ncbi:GDSL esterase/lipase 5 [Solanum tuberosum]|uniref:GDSL esterase/lipase 5 n=1 Tax=Solanum tuberosum TaxID=4113 RepID=M1AIN8_SOLTU|nr:PREDICTED: GDSL esterase/lipase 5 [Solanum tuberosum]
MGEISRRRYTRTEEGNLGCLPGLRMLNPPTKNGCLEEASKLHNVELHNLLLGMQKELKGFTYSLYDFNRSLRQRMNHPSRYGFKEGKRAVEERRQLSNLRFVKAQKGMSFGI